MGLFDKLFVPEESPNESSKGGTQEAAKAQENVQSYDEKVNISGSAAEDIMKNALAPFYNNLRTIKFVSCFLYIKLKCSLFGKENIFYA